MTFKKRWLVYMAVPGVNVIWLLSILFKEIYKIVQTVRGIRTKNAFKNMKTHYYLIKTSEEQQSRAKIASVLAIIFSLLFSMSALNCISAGILTPVPILTIGAVVFFTIFLILAAALVTK